MLHCPTIKAVTLDVGGTLIEPWPSVGHVYAEAAERAGWGQVDAAMLNAQFRAAWRGRAGFDYSRRAWKEVVTLTFAGCGHERRAGDLFEAIYERFEHPDVWRVYEDVFPALEGIKEAGIPMVAVSNWDERLGPLLRGLELDGFFEAVIVSKELGFHKPSPRIFEAALERLRLRPEEVLHVGDSMEEDVLGALGAGMQAVLMDRRGRGERAGSIASLGDLRFSGDKGR